MYVWIVFDHTVWCEYRCMHDKVATSKAAEENCSSQQSSNIFRQSHILSKSDRPKKFSTLCCPHPTLTELIGAVGVGRRRWLFGVQCVGEARSVVWACEGIHSWFARARASGGAARGMQTSGGGRGMRGKLLLLHQQRLVQLTLVLLDLLLHVGDCACNLAEKRSSVTTMHHKIKFWATKRRKTRRLIKFMWWQKQDRRIK